MTACIDFDGNTPGEGKNAPVGVDLPKS
jgi:hypothetical protein